MIQRKYIALLALLVSLAGPASAAELSADQIVKKSHDVYGGDDALETLTFHLTDAKGDERKLTYKMAWKGYDHGKFVRKVIFSTEFPPNHRGESYMVWSYRPDLHRDNDEWMYLPDLREVRKITETQEHADKDKDEFSKRSVLKDPELMPRPPQADRHRLLRTVQDHGKSYYVIESVPRKQMKMYPYSKTLNWINADNFLLRRVDYYGANGQAVKRQIIDWKKIGKAWVWSKVEGTDLTSHARTTLDLSHVRVNVGLQDRVFSKRTLRLGLDSVIR